MFTALVSALLTLTPPPPAGATTLGVAQLATTGNSSCALMNDGSVECWGDNRNGQLGLGDTDSRGDEPNEMGDNLSAVDLGTGRTATAVSGTCALLDNGSVKCWGDNSQGALGLGDTADRGDGPGEMGDDLPAVDLGIGRTATSISAGAAGACALLDNGSVKCWGDNTAGQLGLGEDVTDHRGDAPGEMGDNLPAVDLGTGRTATAIAAGGAHVCALLDDGSVKCWGYNVLGQLGQGDTGNRGDQPGEMGDNLPAIELGTGRTVLAITAGHYQSCALLDDHSVKCWGGNDHGELGAGDTLSRGWQPGSMGDNLPTVELGSGHSATAVAAGSVHTCALLDDGSVKCWGQGYGGRLGLGDNHRRGDEPGEMGDDLPAIDLGVGLSATAVAPGDEYTCAVLQDAMVKCWGANGVGQLGLGDGTVILGDEPGEMGDNLPVVDLGSAEGGRPDARIRRGPNGRQVGNDIYNTTGRGQTRRGVAASPEGVTYFVSVQNDAGFSERLRVQGSGGRPLYRIVYRSPAGSDITARVLAGTFKTPTLAPHATFRITILVRANASGTSTDSRLVATSTTGRKRSDTVHFITETR